MKSFIFWLLRLLYGLRSYNVEALKTPGPVLLLPNHVSWWDWALIGVWLEDDWRFVTSSQTAQTTWLHKRLMINRRTFPVDMNSPFAVKHIAEYLGGGGRLVLFPEGRLSLTGSMMKLFEGTGFLLSRTRAKIITAYIREAYRLPFSPNPSTKKWFPRLSVHFSAPMTLAEEQHGRPAEARARFVEKLRRRMMKQRFETEMQFGPATLPDAIEEAAAIRPGKAVLQDVTMRQLNYRRLLVGAELLAKQWRQFKPKDAGRAGLSSATPADSSRAASEKSPLGVQPSGRSSGEDTLKRGHRTAADEKPDPVAAARVGVLLPNVNALPVSLLSLWMAGKVPAILNYSIGVAGMVRCASLAGLQHIITSKAFATQTGLDLGPFREAGMEVVFLEDVRERISSVEKLIASARAFCRGLIPGLRTSRASCQPGDTAAVLFTSGSEGEPKGVELTHRNLLANIRQMLTMADLLETDRFFNALPMFHSFGLTVGLLLPLVQGTFVFLYVSPLHYRLVPAAFYNLDCNVFFGPNTFLAGYGRKAHPYDFHALRYVFSGGEKLQEATATLWMRKFGVRILEGYGATECSPCVTLNTAMRCRYGSAGQFLPDIEYRLEPVPGLDGALAHAPAEPTVHPLPEHGPVEEVHSEREAVATSHDLHSAARPTGRLFVRGPNIMRGYVNPQANASFQALGGWYDTGDIASVDDEGYLFILGRHKRFAKISGEMVSLTAVEDALGAAFPQFGPKFAIAVIARPDETKGEKIVAVTNEPRLKLEEVREAVRDRGFANLATPRELKCVHELPRLGTGKVSHRELEKMV